MTRRSTLFAWLLCAGIAVAGAPRVRAQCYLTSSTSTEIDPSLTNDINDWGIILHDAKTSGCQFLAQSKFDEKVGKQNARGGWNGPFLQGGSVAFAYGTELVLAGESLSTPATDALLVAMLYPARMRVPGVDNCGVSGTADGIAKWRFGDTCMDDWTVAAEGYAWRAAYFRKTGRGAWRQERQNAINAIRMSFDTDDSICISMPGRPLGTNGPCNASASEINASPSAVVLPLNHGSENANYGIGLVTSLANAFFALSVAQDPVNLESDLPYNASDIRNIMNGLFVQGERATGDSSGTNWSNACYLATSQMTGTSNTTYTGMFSDDDVTLSNPNPTSNDPNPLFAYQPNMYPLYDFYFHYFPSSLDSSGFQFTGNYFPLSIFQANEPNHAAFLGVARREVYYTLTYDWLVNPSNIPNLNAPWNSLGALKTNNGVNYFMASGNGGSSVVANSTSAGWWETFQLITRNGGGSVESGKDIDFPTPHSCYYPPPAAAPP